MHNVKMALCALCVAGIPHALYEVMPKGFEPGWWSLILAVTFVGFIMLGVCCRSLLWNGIAVSVFWLGFLLPDTVGHLASLGDPGAAADGLRGLREDVLFGWSFMFVHLLVQVGAVAIWRRACQRPNE